MPIPADFNALAKQYLTTVSGECCFLVLHLICEYAVLVPANVVTSVVIPVSIT